jgi:hypothetical protein
MVRKMLNDSGLSKGYWGYALQHAIYLYNRLPHSFLGGSTSPYEALFGVKPDLDGLKVWGSPCWRYISKDLRNKLEDTAKQGIFVGYHPVKAGYLVFHPQDRTCAVGRTVKFAENGILTKSSVNDDDDDPPTYPIPPTPQTETDPVTSASNHTEIAEIPPLRKLDGVDPANVLTTSRIRRPVAHDADEGYAMTGVVVAHAAVQDSTYILEPAANQWEQDVAYHHIPYIFSVDIDGDPKTLGQALQTAEKDRWIEAYDKEIDSLEKRGTWERIDALPPGARAIGFTVVMKTKRDGSGQLDKRKARIVAQGFNQIEGIDFFDTFSPVARITAFRFFISMCTILNLNVKYFDVASAFLYPYLDETIYMKAPPRKATDKPGEGFVKLLRAIYGLKQASREWYKQVATVLEGLGFMPSDADPCLFTRGEGPTFVMVLIYVDDGLVGAKDIAILAQLDQDMKRYWEIKSGDATEYIGITIVRDREKGLIDIGQRQYIIDICARFGVSGVCVTPAKTEVLKAEDGQPVDITTYQRIVGSLRFAADTTRPDIAYITGVLGSFLADPRTSHMAAAKHVLKYLNHTKHLVLRYQHDPSFTGYSYCTSAITGFSDASFAADQSTRRSVGGHCFLLGSAVVSYSSKRHTLIDTSTTESEYSELYEAAKQAIYMRKLCNALQFDLSAPILIREDNDAVIKLIKNPSAHGRTKHFDIRYKFVRERIDTGEISVEQCKTEDMVADIFTKPLGPILFNRFRSQLGLVDGRFGRSGSQA